MSKQKILVVDDDPDILNLIKIELERNGFEPILCISVASALKELSVHSFECAVLDIVMGPNETSDEIIKFLKNTSSNILNFDLPMIIISAHVTDDLRIKMIAKDPLIVDALKKPLKKNALSKKIMDILTSQLEADEELDLIFRPFQDASTGATETPTTAKVETAQAMGEAGISPLMEFCFRGNYEKVQEYLINEENANIKERSQDGKTCLHYASRGGNKELVDFILLSGIKVNDRDKRGREPLYEAIQAEDIEMCQHLITKGARVTSKADDITYLMVASQVGNLEIFELLLKLKVNPNVANSEGKTVKVFLKANRQDDFLRLLDKYSS